MVSCFLLEQTVACLWHVLAWWHVGMFVLWWAQSAEDVLNTSMKKCVLWASAAFQHYRLFADPRFARVGRAQGWSRVAVHLLCLFQCLQKSWEALGQLHDIPPLFSKVETEFTRVNCARLRETLLNTSVFGSSVEWKELLRVFTDTCICPKESFFEANHTVFWTFMFVFCDRSPSSHLFNLLCTMHLAPFICDIVFFVLEK